MRVRLGPSSYHCLEWNFVDSTDNHYPLLSDNIATLSEKHGTSKVLQKCNTIQYDQDEAENKYRCLGDKKFQFNPKTFGVDCQQTAINIHRNLLHLNGTDVISLNNPAYFDAIMARMELKNELKLKNLETIRIKQEMHRSIMEKIKISQLSCEKKPPLKNRKFYDELMDKTSRDCENFTFDSRLNSFDSMCGDCERFEFDMSDGRFAIPDSFDEDANINLTYRKAEKFIRRKLIEPKLECPKSMILPPELGISRPPERSVTVPVETSEKPVKQESLPNRIASIFIPTVKIKSCGCKGNK